MNRMKKIEELKMEYNNIEIPRRGKEELQKTILKAKRDKLKLQHRRRMYKMAGAVAAIIAIFILPNTNKTIAATMKNIPVVGQVFEVITFREYNYNDKQKEMSVKIPEIKNSQNISAIEDVNKEAGIYTKRLVEQFSKDIKNLGFNSLDVTYNKVTDTKKWFTLEINVVETQASGYRFRRYYHINKESGKIVKLSDLFKKNCNYIEIISKEIKRQMKAQMKNENVSYFIGTEEVFEGFSKIKNNQNFYFNKDGNMVITFDEYEVAPGSMGMPEFVIPKDITASLYKVSVN